MLTSPSPQMVDWLGYVAATMTSLSFVPQALLTLRTRQVEGISLAMYSLFTVGVALWLGYGVVLQAWPIIVANAITLLLAGCVLGLKIAGMRRASPSGGVH